ncbi:MAG: hypothetical protein HKO59_12120 [Phycisphaerales bacterium]|nr:hypothetical protein [Phycisphaerae bacterium]NNF44489.1 hypothetical protein [Phycisphaerales bacterium]NNM26708.1 hypothetical protein [Phycisphaerales bacterium]
MSQFDSQFGEQPVPGDRKTSGMAITALVFSLIFICPLTTLLGPLLGLIAFFKIGSDPTRKGKGIALTAIVLGLLFTAGWVYGGMKIGKLVGESMQVVSNGAPDALRAGFAGDMATFKAQFHGAGAAATDEEVQAFLGELEQRYGAFVSASFRPDRQASSPQFGTPSQVFPYDATFDQGTREVEAEVVFADQATGQMVMKLGYITVVDDDLGDLTYPPGN